MKIRCASALFFMPLFLCCVCAYGSSYTYVNYSAPDDFDRGKVTFNLDIPSKEIRSYDVVDGIVVCARADEFYCFESSWITFFVPKNGMAVGNLWDKGQVSFKVLREESIKVFGESRPVWVIGAVPSNHLRHILIFYYSEKYGLLAIKDMGGEKVGGQIQFFVITGRKGFPR